MNFTLQWYKGIIPTLGLNDNVIQIVHGYHPDQPATPMQSPWHFTLRTGAIDHHVYYTARGRWEILTL